MKRFAILAAALILAGCQTERPYTGQYEPPMPPPRGAASPTPAPRARTPAASGPIGVLASRETGRYMDDQEAALRQHLRGTGVRVARTGDDLVLLLRSDTLFALNASEVSPAALRTVDALAAVLRQYDKTLIEVNGYTDTTGRDDYNLKLSQHRAEAVADVLVDDGVNPARISPRGFGETHLRIPTGDNVNEPRNRRVEIRITAHVAAS